MSAVGPATAGFYGKLPSLGDFVSRRLPADFVQPWDRWLQDSLAVSQVQLEQAWLDTYLTSPLWRFVLTAGVAGQSAWAGVLMPSVDRVGRYFPLTLACPLPARSNPFRLLSEPEWFERTEALILSGLEDGFSLDAFDTQVATLGVPTAVLTGERPPPRRGTGGSKAWHLAAPSPKHLKRAYSTLLTRALGEIFFAYSLWWSSGSQGIAPSFLICQGLPPPEGFVALLNGEWAERGWWMLNGAEATDADGA